MAKYNLGDELTLLSPFGGFQPPCNFRITDKPDAISYRLQPQGYMGTIIASELQLDHYFTMRQGVKDPGYTPQTEDEHFEWIYGITPTKEKPKCGCGAESAHGDIPPEMHARYCDVFKEQDQQYWREVKDDQIRSTMNDHQ